MTSKVDNLKNHALETFNTIRKGDYSSYILGMEETGKVLCKISRMLTTDNTITEAFLSMIVCTYSQFDLESEYKEKYINSVNVTEDELKRIEIFYKERWDNLDERSFIIGKIVSFNLLLSEYITHQTDEFKNEDEKIFDDHIRKVFAIYERSLLIELKESD